MSKLRKESRIRLGSIPAEAHSHAESTPFQLESEPGNRFFPDASPLSPFSKMTAMLKNLDIDKRPSRPSSFGLLPEECLDDASKDMSNLRRSFEFKKPFDPTPLKSKLLEPSTPKQNVSCVDIDAILGSTVDANDTAVDHFNWTEEVFNQVCFASETIWHF